MAGNGAVKCPQQSSAPCNRLFSAQFKGIQRPLPDLLERRVLSWLWWYCHFSTKCSSVVMTSPLVMNSVLAPGQLYGGGCPHLAIVVIGQLPPGQSAANWEAGSGHRTAASTSRRPLPNRDCCSKSQCQLSNHLS